MSYLQFLVDIERLLEMMAFLIEFTLDVEKGLIVWAEGKTLAYELLEICIVLVVDAQIYCRRNDVIVGRIVIRCLLESDDGKLIFIGFCASLYEVDEYRFTVLLVTRTEISLQVWNSFFILAAVYQIGCRKVRCFISFDFFILSFLFLCKGRKKSQYLLVHFGSILLVLPILDRFLLQIYKKIIKESHKSIKKAANGSFFTICSFFFVYLNARKGFFLLLFEVFLLSFEVFS